MTKSKFIKAAFLFCALLLAWVNANAQQANGKITGRVIDSAAGSPVGYASISLDMQDSNKVVNGTITDDKGDFKLTGLADGTYKLLIFFVGYHTLVKNNIVVDKNNPAISLGNLKLAGTAAALKAVTVAADKSVIENKVDKIVYNVDNDLTSKGGVATDVLQKVPEVTVDVDGNVELQGNSNVRFLIDGKPSTIFGNNITDVLQSIHASQIQSIEVITSPGAKYDAEGTGGIINIILKKNKTEGINGNISLTGGTRLENGSVELSAHKGSFSANAFFSGDAQLLSTTINSMNRLGQDTANQTTRLIQNGTSQFSMGGYESGLGLEWNITPKNIISGSVGFDYFENNNPGNSNRQTIQQDVSGNPLSDVTNLVNTANNFNQQTLDWSLGYKRKFKKDGQELDLLYTSSYSNNSSYYQQQQEYISPPTIYNSSYGNNLGTQKETDISLDYSQPLGKGFLLETGAKATLNNINSVSDIYLLNTATGNYDYSNSQSFSLNYTSNVYAGYVSGTFKLFRFLDVTAGFRDEYTHTNAYFSNSGNANIQPYNTTVPAITVSHNFKNNQTVSASYSYRIERPRYSDLNPFIDASDPQNVVTGNPNLRPEIGNKIELSYSHIFSKGASIIITPFYRWNINDLQTYTFFYPDYVIGDSTYNNVSVTTRENIGEEANLGISLFGSIPITSKIDLRPTVMLIDRHIYTGLSSGGDVHGFIYRIKVNATYQVTSTLGIEVFGNFRSLLVNAEGTKPAFTSYEIALRQQLFHKKGSIALTTTNPFAEYVNQTTNFTGQNFTMVSTRELPYRSFGINITYMFGKKGAKKKIATPDSGQDNGDE